jgi:hypothetical protein
MKDHRLARTDAGFFGFETRRGRWLVERQGQLKHHALQDWKEPEVWICLTSLQPFGQSECYWRYSITASKPVQSVRNFDLSCFNKRDSHQLHN